MRSEWPLCKVTELQEEGILLVEDGNHGESRPRPSEFQSHGVAFIRAADISDNGRILFENAGRISDVAFDRIRKGKAQPGDILFSHKGTVGKLALAPPDAPPFVCSPQTTFWRTLDAKRLDRRFLYTFMRSEEFRRQWFARKGETDMADYVSLTAQRTFEVPVPPVGEQKAITSVIAPLDDKIEANRALSETLEATCQALFRSWFVAFDPVVAKGEGRQPPHLTAEVAALFPDRFEDSQIGPVPAGWAVEPLDSIADFENGLALQKHRPAPGEEQLPVIKIAQLRDGAPGTEEWASANIKTSCILDDGDVVFSWSGSLMVTIWCGGRGALNQHLFKVTSDRFPKWFYHQWTMHHLPEFQGIAADKATTMGHIRRHHLTEAACVVAPPEVIAAADRLLGPSLESFVAAALESSTLATLRDALLPRLLSGELRVRQAEKLVEEAV